MFNSLKSLECLQSLWNNPSGLVNWLPYKFNTCKAGLIPMTFSLPERSINFTDEPFKCWKILFSLFMLQLDK